jgi:manganese efflux pump family protein
MDLLDIVIIAVGLAMDCLAVSLACGMVMAKFKVLPSLKIAFFFGLFQGAMPLIGWFAGSKFNQYISNFDHWIAFIILVILGGKMIYEHFKGGDDCSKKKLNPYKLSVIITLAIATSIDALAVGLTFAFLDFQPVISALTIGVITFVISIIGILLGARYGCRLKIPAELLGGLVLIGIGSKILLEHLFF